MIQKIMSVVVKITGMSLEHQRKLTKRFTYRTTTRHRGETVLGTPFAGFMLSSNKQYVCLPLHAGRGATAAIQGTSSVACPDMQFTGKLHETHECDQQSAMKEAEQHLAAHGTTLLALRTGFGKTVCAGYLATNVCKKRTLILVCRTALLRQWTSELRATTNASVAQGTPSADTHILVCTPGTLDHVQASWLDGVGTLVLDEAVDMCTPGRFPDVLRIHPDYVIACTATPTRPDGLHCMLEDIVGTHRVVRTNATAFHVTRLLTSYKPTIVQNDQGVDWTALQYDLFFSHQRNYCLVRTVADAVANGHKVLVLTAYTGHVDLLMLLLADEGIDATRFDGQRKSYTNARVLIGNTKKVGVGFDEKSHCDNFDGERINLLVLACSTKQFEVLQQYVGRVVGRAAMPSVVHLVDEDPRIKGSHWRVAKSWYLANKGTVSDKAWTDIPTTQWHLNHRSHARTVLAHIISSKEETGIVEFLRWLYEYSV